MSLTQKLIKKVDDDIVWSKKLIIKVYETSIDEKIIKNFYQKIINFGGGQKTWKTHFLGGGKKNPICAKIDTVRAHRVIFCPNILGTKIWPLLPKNVSHGIKEYNRGRGVIFSFFSTHDFSSFFDIVIFWFFVMSAPRENRARDFLTLVKFKTLARLTRADRRNLVTHVA